MGALNLPVGPLDPAHLSAACPAVLRTALVLPDPLVATGTLQQLKQQHTIETTAYNLKEIG